MKLLLKALIISCLFVSTSFASNLFSSPLKSTSDPVFATVEENLSKATTVTGQFEQQRHLQLLSAPLTSSGNFVLSRKKGLTWNQIKPFHSVLRLTTTKLEQQIGDAPPTLFTKEKQPIIFSFTNIFLSIFNGNTTELKKYFDVYFTGTPEKWSLGLKPNSSPLNKAISTITVEGDQAVRHIVIREVRANEMTIDFTHVTVKPE